MGELSSNKGKANIVIRDYSVQTYILLDPIVVLLVKILLLISKLKCCRVQSHNQALKCSSFFTALLETSNCSFSSKFLFYQLQRHVSTLGNRHARLVFHYTFNCFQNLVLSNSSKRATKPQIQSVFTPEILSLNCIAITGSQCECSQVIEQQIEI